MDRTGWIGGSWTSIPAAATFAFCAACTVQTLSSGDGGGRADASAGEGGAGGDLDAGGDASTVDRGDGMTVPACPTGQAFCNGTCIGTTQDDKNCGSCGHTCSGATHCGGGTCKASPIQHVVLVVQENHTFESYFGLYCQAAAGSHPTCTAGPNCCEGAPATDPSGATPQLLDDDTGNAASNFYTDRNHDQACELQEIDNGNMDKFVTGATEAACGGKACSNDYNWALADGSSASGPVYHYWTLASANAIADRYFQPIAGGTASNNMYFASARFRFVDNGEIPTFAAGETSSSPPGLCTDSLDPLSCLAAPQALYQDGNIASLLLDAGKTFAVYADGYAAASAAAPSCPSKTAATECPWSDCVVHPVACNGCIFDPSDIPFLFFGDFNTSTSKHFGNIKDYGSLAQDIAAQQLPSFSFVKARLFHNEHPNMSTISAGVAFVTSTIQMIQQSPYANSTLILLTWDEGGGFFDHVTPPTAWATTVDHDDSGGSVVTVQAPRKWSISFHLLFRPFHSIADGRLRRRGGGLARRANRGAGGGGRAEGRADLRARSRRRSEGRADRPARGPGGNVDRAGGGAHEAGGRADGAARPQLA